MCVNMLWWLPQRISWINRRNTTLRKLENLKLPLENFPLVRVVNFHDLCLVLYRMVNRNRVTVCLFQNEGRKKWNINPQDGKKSTMIYAKLATRNDFWHCQETVKPDIINLQCHNFRYTLHLTNNCWCSCIWNTISKPHSEKAFVTFTWISFSCDYRASRNAPPRVGKENCRWENVVLRNILKWP